MCIVFQLIKTPFIFLDIVYTVSYHKKTKKKAIKHTLPTIFYRIV